MDRRKVYSIFLKILTLFGVVIIMAVMINSLFPVKKITSETEPVKDDNQPQTVSVPIGSLLPGKMLMTQWAGKPVAILKRINPVTDFVSGEPLNQQWRSIKPEYFVFYNAVGAAQCPLYLMPSGEQLKDTCSGILYDAAGQRVEGDGSALQIPPHYFLDEQGTNKETTLVIGQWEPEGK